MEDKASIAVDMAMNELANFDMVAGNETETSSSSEYIHHHRHEYIRTVRDIISYAPLNGGEIRVLEIGAFFGVVCMALSYLGYTVTAADIPEYIELPAQVERYAKYGIKTKGIRLEEFILPFDDEIFDVIIMCEVLEHLNFNPLPLLKEINRIGKPQSIFYLSLPNLASIYNRKRFLFGDSVGLTVDSFYGQLDPKVPEIANGHWREYTLSETRQMLEPLGYRMTHQYYFSLGETQPVSGIRKRMARALFERFPAFKENQTTIAVREKRTDIVFSIPSTVHPVLREL